MKIEGGVETTKWGNGMMSAGEVLGSLALVKEIVNKTKNLNTGEVTACSDNKHVLNNLENEVKKESQSDVEAGATVEGTRRALKHMKAKAKFEHSKPDPRTNKTLSKNPG